MDGKDKGQRMCCDITGTVSYKKVISEPWFPGLMLKMDRCKYVTEHSNE
jgi:hypothetical protein